MPNDSPQKRYPPTWYETLPARTAFCYALRALDEKEVSQCQTNQSGKSPIKQEGHRPSPTEKTPSPTI